MTENNEMEDPNKKNKGKNSSGKNAEIETKLDDKKVELDVPKSSFSKYFIKLNIIDFCQI